MPDPSIFHRYDAFILDMDGTLTRGATLIPGAETFLRLAVQAGKRLVILTDNSTQNREEVAARLSSPRASFSAEQVVTSSHAAARELYRRRGPCRVYLIGEPGFASELEAFGHEVVAHPPADVVAVGFTSSFSYRTLARALPMLASGAPLWASDEAPVYAAPEGTMPGAGSLVGALRGMGYAPAMVAGKPRGAAVDLSLELTGTPPDRVALIGDSLPNDGGAADHLGIDFLLVLTGVCSVEEARQAGHPPGPSTLHLPMQRKVSYARLRTESPSRALTSPRSPTNPTRRSDAWTK